MDPNTPFAGAVDLSKLAKPAPAQSTPGGEADGTAVVEVTEANFADVVQLSMQRPVFVMMCSAAAPQCDEFVRRVGLVAADYVGRIVLASVDVDREPGIGQAFQIQAVPAMVAILSGRPAPLFQGSPDEEQLRDVFAQVLEVAAQSGMNVGESPQGDAPAEPPVPPLHAKAHEAIEREDYEGALAAYDQALTENPKDADARAGRAQVALLSRTRDADLQQVRRDAADRPADVPAQLAAADMDVAGGKLDDAFGRLLDLLPTVAGDERDTVRARLVELFEVAGAADPRVVAARQRLAAALY